MADNDQVVSVHLLAKLVNLTDRRVQQLAGEGVMIKVPKERGKYYLQQSITNYCTYLQSLVQKNDDMTRKAIRREKEARARKAEYDADAKEFEMSVKTGEYVELEWVLGIWREHADDIIRLTDEMIAIIKRDVPQIPFELAEKLDRHLADCHKRINELRYQDEENASEPSVGSHQEPILQDSAANAN